MPGFVLSDHIALREGAAPEDQSYDRSDDHFCSGAAQRDDNRDNNWFWFCGCARSAVQFVQLSLR